MSGPLKPQFPPASVGRTAPLNLPSLQRRVTTASLERQLAQLASRYKSKISKPDLNERTLQNHLDSLEKGGRFGHFFVSPFLIDRVVGFARKLSRESNPIVIDMGGGTSSTHRQFAEKGLTSICIDPAAEVLKKLAETDKMVQIAEGVWKDRELDYYLVVGDARTAAEIFGLDASDPALSSLQAQKNKLTGALKALADQYETAELDMSDHSDKLEKIRELAGLIGHFKRTGNIDRQHPLVIDTIKGWRFIACKSYHEEPTTDEIGQRLEDKKMLMEEQYERSRENEFVASYRTQINPLIDRLLAVEAQLERGRIAALERHDEPPVTLVFCGYMPYEVDFTPEIKAILPRGIVYVAEEGSNTCTGVTVDPQDKLQLMRQGYFSRSFKPGDSYTRVRSILNPQPEGYRVVVTCYDSIIIQARKDVPIA